MFNNFVHEFSFEWFLIDTFTSSSCVGNSVPQSLQWQLVSIKSPGSSFRSFWSFWPSLVFIQGVGFEFWGGSFFILWCLLDVVPFSPSAETIVPASDFFLESLCGICYMEVKYGQFANIFYHNLLTSDFVTLWGEDTCKGWWPREYMGWGGAGVGGSGNKEPALLIKWACSCCRCTPGCILKAGLMAPADKWP